LGKRRYQTLAGFKVKYRWPTSKARKRGAGESEGEGRLASNLKTKLCACSSQHVASLPGPAERSNYTILEFLGGSTITGYVISIHVISGSDVEQCDTESINEVTTSHIISAGRLQQLTWYRFAVAATTDAGRGPWSQLSDQVRTNSGCHIM